MIEIIGCILLIIIGIFFICMTVDELRTNYELRKSSEQGSDNNDLLKENKQLKERINKALNKIDNMFDRGDANTIIDDLLELDKILKGSDSNVKD